MASTVRTLSVAKETTFGSLDASNLPSTAGLTFVSIPCEVAPLTPAGDPIFSERTDTTDGLYNVSPELNTVWSGGSRVQHRKGPITFKIDLTTVGASANYTSNYLGHILGAGFSTQIPSQTSDTATVSSVNEYTPASAPALADTGTIIGAELAGIAEYSAITDVDASGQVRISPALSASFTGTPTVRHLQTWFSASRSQTGAVVNTCAFQLNGVDFRTNYFGCVMESVSISLDNHRLMAEFTFQCAHIIDDHASASGPVEPAYNSGAAPFFTGCYAVVSDGAPSTSADATAGDSLGRIALDVQDFTFSVTHTLAEKGHSNSILGMSGMEIGATQAECTLSITEPNTTINDLFNRTTRQLIIGTGPVGNGKGCALMLPSAVLRTDPKKYDTTGEISMQTLTYSQGRFAGDYEDGGTGVYEANAGCSPIRIALGVGS